MPDVPVVGAGRTPVDEVVGAGEGDSGLTTTVGDRIAWLVVEGVAVL